MIRRLRGSGQLIGCCNNQDGRHSFPQVGALVVIVSLLASIGLAGCTHEPLIAPPPPSGTIYGHVYWWSDDMMLHPTKAIVEAMVVGGGGTGGWGFSEADGSYDFCPGVGTFDVSATITNAQSVISSSPQRVTITAESVIQVDIFIYIENP